MKIGICSDHAGFLLKQEVIKLLENLNYIVEDFGTHSTESMDYPDVANPMGRAIQNGDLEKGIAICGTGNGMAICLNKYSKIRAGLAWDNEIAKLIRQHNDANVLVMPARFIPTDLALVITKTWLSTPFEGGRHQNRLNKIGCCTNG